MQYVGIMSIAHLALAILWFFVARQVLLDVIHAWPNFFASFTCSHKIEVPYQEAVALKRQEELIREEEAAWLAESEQKAKRGATEKEKKLKKKQVACFSS